MKNRKQKLDKLRQASIEKEKLDLLKTQSEKESIDKFNAEFLDAIGTFKTVLDQGIDVNGISDILDSLKELSSMKKPISVLEKKIGELNMPDIPTEIGIKGIDKLTDILSNKNKNSIDKNVLKDITNSINNLSSIIKESKVPQGQKPGDFIPTRRVMKVGNTLMFDDSFYTGGGGGGSTSTSSTGTSVSKLLLDDYTTASVTYIGKAAIGSATSSAVWQVQKIDETTGMAVTYAGTGAFDQIWNNRTSLTYS